MRDTVDLPAHGWTLIRWISDNPGTWIVHCHIEAHMMMGMLFVVNTGHRDPKNRSRLIASGVPPPPKSQTYCANAKDVCPLGASGCPCTDGGVCCVVYVHTI